MLLGDSRQDRQNWLVEKKVLLLAKEKSAKMTMAY